MRSGTDQLLFTQTSTQTPGQSAACSPRRRSVSIRSVIGPGGGWWYHEIINLGPPRLPHPSRPPGSCLPDQGPHLLGEDASRWWMMFLLLAVRTSSSPHTVLLPPSSSRFRAGKQTAPHRRHVQVLRTEPPLRSPPPPRWEQQQKMETQRKEPLVPAAACSVKDWRRPCYTIAPRLCLSDWRVLLLSPFSDPLSGRPTASRRAASRWTLWVRKVPEVRHPGFQNKIRQAANIDSWPDKCSGCYSRSSLLYLYEVHEVVRYGQQ